MRPARRPATRAPRPSWQNTAAANSRAEIDEAAAGRRGRARPFAKSGRGVDQGAECRRGDHQVQRQPLLRDLGALAQARGHHPPADDRLERQEAGGEGDLPAERALELAAPPEPQARNDKGRADDARQQAVAPFPPEDGLEALERHIRIERRELRDLLIAVELGLPFRAAQRRDHAGHRLPLGDREAGFGEPRRAADQNHEEDETGHRNEPEANGGSNLEAGGLGGGGRAAGQGHRNGTSALLELKPWLLAQTRPRATPRAPAAAAGNPLDDHAAVEMPGRVAEDREDHQERDEKR